MEHTFLCTQTVRTLQTLEAPDEAALVPQVGLATLLANALVPQIGLTTLLANAQVPQAGLATLLTNAQS